MMTLPQRRCGGWHSSISCPACIAGDNLERAAQSVRDSRTMLDAFESQFAGNDERRKFARFWFDRGWMMAGQQEDSQ